MTGDGKFQDLSRLSAQERADLLDTLDAGRRSEKSSVRREHDRLAYRASEIAVLLVQPGGSIGRFLVTARNLSAGGMAFVHGGFVHPGVECRVVLMTRSGERKLVLGKVRSCRHIGRHLHEIGVQFFAAIDPSEFVDPTCAKSSSDTMFEVDAPAEPRTLAGRVVHVADQALDRRVITSVVGATGLDVAAFATVAGALEHLEDETCDAMLLVLLPGEADQQVAALRSGGFAGPLIALRPLEAVRAPDGVAASFVKPVRLSDVVAELIAVLPQRDSAEAGPIMSTMRLDPEMSGRLTKYVVSLQADASRLRGALAGGQIKTAATLCAQLSSQAGAYGFACIARAAGAAAAALAEGPGGTDGRAGDGGPATPSTADAEALLGLLSRVRAAPLEAEDGAAPAGGRTPGSAAA